MVFAGGMGGSVKLLKCKAGGEFLICVWVLGGYDIVKNTWK